MTFNYFCNKRDKAMAWRSFQTHTDLDEGSNKERNQKYKFRKNEIVIAKKKLFKNL